MLAYKGFEKGLICRGYQFIMGKNVTDQANCQRNGFHCAANPLDCLYHYPNIYTSEYYLVKAEGDLDEDAYDSKISCTELTILRRLDVEQLNFYLYFLSIPLYTQSDILFDAYRRLKSRCLFCTTNCYSQKFSKKTSEAQ